MASRKAKPFIGTAGWSIPRASAGHFPEEGSHLQRYARVLNLAEINSSFYRPHQQKTYVRWAEAVPAGFRFAVKLPKSITHERRLVACATPLTAFLDQAAGLGEKLGTLLIQLPPSFAFDEKTAGRFFALLRRRYAGLAACEPRHPGWFEPGAGRLLSAHRIARVAADPAVVPGAVVAGGWPGQVYVRLHGSPRMYWSSYGAVYLKRLAQRLSEAPRGASVWCVFDNTASGAALANALALRALLQRAK